MTRGNPNYFLTYGNGKSAARVVRRGAPACVCGLVMSVVI